MHITIANITTTSAAPAIPGRSGATRALNEVNRGDGWQITGNTAGTSYGDFSPLAGWKYRTTFVANNRMVGQISPETAVLVQAAPAK